MLTSSIFRILIFACMVSSFSYAIESFIGNGKQDVYVRQMPTTKSDVVYILKKDMEVTILRQVRVKGKTWYELDNGFVVKGYVLTNEKNIPLVKFSKASDVKKLILEEIKHKDNPTVETKEEVIANQTKEETFEKVKLVEPKKEVLEEKIDKTTQETKVVQEEIKEKVEPTLKTQIQPIKQTYEPIVIVNDEKSLLEQITQYINFTYILYIIIVLVILLILFLIFLKLFSGPSISQQVEEQKRMRDSLKEVLSKKEESKQEE